MYIIGNPKYKKKRRLKNKGTQCQQRGHRKKNMVIPHAAKIVQAKTMLRVLMKVQNSQ